MATHPWHQAALAELGQLRPDTAQPEEAWRALVLVGRLLSAPQALLPEGMWLQALPALQLVAGPSEPSTLVERLAAALEADDDPSGPLHDVLLDIDDELVVSAMAGGASMAGELAARAQALISLWPERVLSLAEFAESRLVTSRPDSFEHHLWSTVMTAPGLILADALPRVTEASIVRIHRAATALVVVHIPDDFLRAAAGSPARIDDQLGERVWLEVSGGVSRVEVAGRRPGATRLVLQATEEGGDEVLVERIFVVEHQGTTATIVLGDEGVFERIAEEAGRTLGSLKIRMLVGEDDDS